MATFGDLVGVCLIEKDMSSDVLWTWSYPTISAEYRELLMRKCCLKAESNDLEPFIFGQFEKRWYYLYTAEMKSNNEKVTHITVILLAKDFNPEKYEGMCKILCSRYTITGNPASILELYLSVLTKGLCTGEDGEMFTVKEFDPRKAFIQTSIKDVINIFGVESILIYTALLLKKRVAVYSPRVKTLLDLTRALPVLVWHRQNWSIVHPYVHLEDNEIEGLKSQVTYVAGFTDASSENKTELYDLFVNAATGKITIAPHARETFQMGKIHKDIAMLMTEAAKDDDYSDQTLIKELASKTQGLITNLKKLAVASADGKEPKVMLETLKEKNLSSTMENFLFDLATAEGLT